MSTVIIGKQGAVVRRTSQRIVVTYDSAILRTMRLRDVEQLTLIGNVQITASAMTALLDAGVETTLLSQSGRLRGRLVGPENGNVLLRRSQVLKAEDPAEALRIARRVVSAKLRNARRLIQRHQQNHPSPRLEAVVERLQAARARALRVLSMETLRGVEGDSARHYFLAFSDMVRGDLAFHGRSRRPPRDPVNAALSFGYALLTSEVEGALYAEGLDPGIGFLHGLHYSRPSLALDIVEEFRQPVVDRLVLSLVNRRILRAEHFTGTAPGAVFLGDSGRPILIEAFREALGVESFETSGGEGMRVAIRRQAARMRAAISDGGRPYAPYHAP